MCCYSDEDFNEPEYETSTVYVYAEGKAIFYLYTTEGPEPDKWESEYGCRFAPTEKDALEILNARMDEFYRTASEYDVDVYKFDVLKLVRLLNPLNRDYPCWVIIADIKACMPVESVKYGDEWEEDPRDVAECEDTIRDVMYDVLGHHAETFFEFEVGL